MVDDIDDLLDEVESRFCKNDKKLKTNKSSSSPAVVTEPKSMPARKPLRYHVCILLV